MTSTHTSNDHRPHRRSSSPPTRTMTTLVWSLALTAVSLSGCGLNATADPQALTQVGAPQTVTMGYTGGVQEYTVPSGVTRLTITGSGGAGGDVHAVLSFGGLAAEVTGTVQVEPGQLLLVSVGERGADAGTKDKDGQGGWGGLGAAGGNGNAASDYLRTSGAGGGATTVQLAAADGSDPQAILVAGGGGGDGAPSGDPAHLGPGGSAGCTAARSDQPTPSWQGQDGGDTGDLHGGKGGAAGGAAGMAGLRGQGGSGLGGNGGGGGGGLLGGGPGTGASGTSAGGGGGAGTSATAGMTETSVKCRDTDGSGQVQITPGTT